MGYGSQGTDPRARKRLGLLGKVCGVILNEEQPLKKGVSCPFLPSVSQTVMERAGEGCAVAAAAFLHL